VVAGGVGANRSLRAALAEQGRKSGVDVLYPRVEFCTDNGAMVALLGYLRLAAGESDDLAIRARARWPMEELTATLPPPWTSSSSAA
jgi:N6-L-threonylcarbamoyladenine synthase